MKLRNIIRFIALVPLAVYLLYCCYHVITNESRPTYLDCGKVVSKSNDEVAIKHGTRTELYLNIEFRKSGFRSIECEPTTYFSKEVGDNVCFNLNKDVSIWFSINNIAGFITLFVAGFAVLFKFILHLLPESWRAAWYN